MTHTKLFLVLYAIRSLFCNGSFLMINMSRSLSTNSSSLCPPRRPVVSSKDLSTVDEELDQHPRRATAALMFCAGWDVRLCAVFCVRRIAARHASKFVKEGDAAFAFAARGKKWWYSLRSSWTVLLLRTHPSMFGYASLTNHSIVAIGSTGAGSAYGLGILTSLSKVRTVILQICSSA